MWSTSGTTRFYRHQPPSLPDRKELLLASELGHLVMHYALLRRVPGRLACAPSAVWSRSASAAHERGGHCCAASLLLIWKSAAFATGRSS